MLLGAVCRAAVRRRQGHFSVLYATGGQFWGSMEYFFIFMLNFHKKRLIPRTFHEFIVKFSSCTWRFALV